MKLPPLETGIRGNCFQTSVDSRIMTFWDTQTLKIYLPDIYFGKVIWQHTLIVKGENKEREESMDWINNVSNLEDQWEEILGWWLNPRMMAICQDLRVQSSPFTTGRQEHLRGKKWSPWNSMMERIENLLITVKSHYLSVNKKKNYRTKKSKENKNCTKSWCTYEAILRHGMLGGKRWTIRVPADVTML